MTKNSEVYPHRQPVEKKVCNKCGKAKKSTAYLHSWKKTCKKCETKWWMQVLRMLVRDRKLSPIEKLAVRAGYFGTGMMIASVWLLNPYTYMVGLSCIIFQTAVRKQWNLVLLNFHAFVVWFLRALEILGYCHG